MRTSRPGKGVTSEPVAIRMFFVLIFSVDPSGLSTVTSLGPVIRPKPFMCVTCTAQAEYHNNVPHLQMQTMPFSESLYLAD